MKLSAITALFAGAAGMVMAQKLPEINAPKAWNKPAAAEKVEVVKPQFAEGNMIVCGNKSLIALPDGRIRINCGGRQLAEIRNYYVIANTGTKKINWESHDPKLSSVKRDGNKLIWQLKKQTPEGSWISGEQTLEILDDGRVKLAGRFFAPDNKTYKLNSKKQSFWIVLPAAQADGSMVNWNGKEFKLDLNNPSIPGDWKNAKFDAVFYADNPEFAFSVTALKPEIFSRLCINLPKTRNFRMVFEFGKDPLAGEMYLDLRRAPKKKSNLNARGGIDFKALDDLEMPELRRNLLPNSSFEQGLAGYRMKHSNRDRQWDWTPFSIVEKGVFHGKYALEMHARSIPDVDVRRLAYGVNLTTMAIPCLPGEYTVSFTAKSSEKSGSKLNFWIPRFTSGSVYAYFSNRGKGSFDLDDQYRRYSATFTVTQAMPVEIHFNVWSASGKDAKVTIDAIQLERGSKMTAYDAPDTMGRLLTSEADNFISASQKVNGRMELFSVNRSAEGIAELEVKNFFGEIVLRKNIPFSTDKNGGAVIDLPLDEVPGKGVFVVKVQYRFANGSGSYEFHRFAKVDFLNGTHKLKRLFSCDYDTPERSFDYLKKLDRYRKLGIGAKGHHYSFDKIIWDTELAYGIEPMTAFTMSEIVNSKRKRIGFGIVDSSKWEAGLSADDPRFMVRDYYHDNGGKITPEYLEKVKNAAKVLAAKHPHVKIWNFGGEVSARFAYDWWSKEGTMDQYAWHFAQIMKAFSDGVREGNPGVKVTQEDPCNMNPDGGIAEVDRFLYYSNKLGAKYDIISIHPYRYSPEAPDLEEDTAKLFAVLEKHGYGNTPVSWPEMMHWGPYHIPAWGTEFARWVSIPAAWPGGVLSYDLGRYERISASFYARSFLVALRHSDRIVTATMGNMRNNFALDVMFTPYSASLVPNTLSNILGNSKFIKDIRFAPYMRCYIFDDGTGRPVAAVWCHLPAVDEGKVDAPVVEADFGNSLECVLDLMNSPRKFNAGKFRFPVSGLPVFFRGKKGTAEEMIKAFNNASVVSGEGISPVGTNVFISSKETADVEITNFLSKPFSGKINGQKLEIPGNGKIRVPLKLAEPLRADRIFSQPFNFTISGDKSVYNYQMDIYGAKVLKVDDNVTLQTVDFSRMAAIPLPGKEKGTTASGVFRAAWNRKALFLEFEITDNKFIHVEYEKPGARWNNDCVQLYIDTLADGRNKKARKFDENDYSYALFPASDGQSIRFYRVRSVDGQLALGNSTPQNNTFADDIPTEFILRDGKLIYRTAIPAKYLLPLKLEANRSFGFGLFIPDCDEPEKRIGSLSTVIDGDVKKQNQPAHFPHLVLSLD